jgi:hypothetical protein
MALIAAAYITVLILGEAGWGYLCTGEPDIGDPGACITTIWPDISYSKLHFLGFDLLTVWLYLAPLLVGLAGLATAVAVRSQKALAVAWASTFSAAALVVTFLVVSPGASLG